MPFDPDKLKAAQGTARTLNQEVEESRFDPEKLRTAQSIPVRDIPAAIGKFAKQSALPLAGQLLGTGAGLATAPFVGPAALPLTIGLESAGGAAGEAMNQRLGITEPSLGQIGLQAIAPAVVRGGGALMRAGKELAPPTTKGAEFLNRIAAPEARLQLSKMAAPDAEAVFRRAYQSGATFHTGNTLPTIDRALSNLGRGANAEQLYGRTMTILKNLREKIAANNGELNPAHYQTELRDLGAALRTAEGRTINKVEQGAVKDVYGALAQALNNTSIPGPRPAGAPAINPQVVQPGTAVAPIPQPQGPITVNRNMGSPTPLQPNVPSTHVNLPRLQPSEPVPFNGGQSGVPGAPFTILPAPSSPGPAGPTISATVQPPGAGAAAGATGRATTSRGQNAMAAQDLLLARQYVKRSAVLDEIEESVTKADKILRGQGDNTQFNAAAVLRDLKQNPFWNGTKGERNPAFTAGEKQQIESIFTLLNKLPALQPGAGVNAGSKLVNTRLGMAGMGSGGAGVASGGDPILTAVGAVAGATVPTMVSFGRVLNIALRTETGRTELLDLLRQPGATIANVTTALTSALTASQAQPGPMQRMPVPLGTPTTPTPFGLER